MTKGCAWKNNLVRTSFIFLHHQGILITWKLSCGEVGPLGGVFFCGSFDVHFGGECPRPWQSCAQWPTNLLHQHCEPWHRELQSCRWTCCPTLSTKIGVNDKLSDLTQLRYMPASPCSCSPISAVTTCSHMHTVPGAGLAKPLWSHQDPKAFTQPQATRDVWRALCACVCTQVCWGVPESGCQELPQLPWFRLTVPDLASSWKQGPSSDTAGIDPFCDYLNIQRDKTAEEIVIPNSKARSWEG